jgi:hypothetical protein
MGRVLTIEIGATVRLSDGSVGEITRLVLEPASRRITHLVVKPKHSRPVERLVPINRFSTDEHGLELSCTIAELDQCDSANEVQVVRERADIWRDNGSILAFPFLPIVGPLGRSEMTTVSTIDRIPFGEIEVHAGGHVHARDGRLGTLRGVLIDGQDHRMSHLLLDEGHLWGQREVALPAEAVTVISDRETAVSWSESQVKSLAGIEPTSFESPDR